MMAILYLGIRIPNRAYEHIQLENVDLQKPIDSLKDKISQKINYPKDEIQLVYRGNVLEDNMDDVKIQPNTTIHVFKKTSKPKIYTSNSTYTDEQCQKIANIFGTVTGTQLSVQTRMNILQKIIAEYPEFRRNLGAQALIRDSVLFHSLDKVEVIKKISKNYSVICEAAEFIVKTTKKELAKNEIDHFSEELFSSSSSEEENSSNPNQSEQAQIRRISHDQLAAAIQSAGLSINSLSNIAQRNSMINEQRQQRLYDSSSSTSNTNPSPTTLSTPPIISQSLLNNALTQALLSTASAQNTTTADSNQQQQQQNISSGTMMDTSEPLSSQRIENIIQQQQQQQQKDRLKYAPQLQLMREMGLSDDNINIQALILSNGEVEAAVTLVLGGMNNLFN